MDRQEFIERTELFRLYLKCVVKPNRPRWTKMLKKAGVM